jgi:hypothetical protein
MTKPTINDRNSNAGLIGLGPIPSTAPVASFNANQIESLIKTKGFIGFHYMSAPNPNRESLSSPPDPMTQASFQGLLYYDVRPIYLVPQSIKLEERLQVAGIYGVDTILLNISGQYYDNRPNRTVHVAHNDLIVMNPTITDKAKQLFEYNPNGPNQLTLKVKGVEFLADENIEYEDGTDFAVVDGEIHWLKGGKKPSFVNGKPAVLTCVYYATPMYAIMSLPHNLRILPSNDIGHGGLPRDAVYAPQLVVAKELTSMQVQNILDWKTLPPLPNYADSMNTTGGSF